MKPRRTKTAEPQLVTVLTIAQGSVGAYTYISGLLLEGVPHDIVQAHAWMESDPEKVKAARAAGIDAVPYRG